jgi:GAF domain-containing protein
MIKDKATGVINVESDQLDAFDESDVAVLQSLAHQAAIAIQNARLFKAERRRAEEFRVILQGRATAGGGVPRHKRGGAPHHVYPGRR